MRNEKYRKNKLYFRSDILMKQKHKFDVSTKIDKRGSL